MKHMMVNMEKTNWILKLQEWKQIFGLRGLFLETFMKVYVQIFSEEIVNGHLQRL